MSTVKRFPDRSYQQVPVDQDEYRDLAPDGNSLVSAMTLHVPGVTARADVYAQLHYEITASQQRHVDQHGPTPALCGVEHVEDSDASRVPRAARPSLQQAMRQARRSTGRPVVLIRGWQHVGACPTPPTPTYGHPDGRDRSLTMATASSATDTDTDRPDSQIKFLGMSAALADPPEPGDTQVFTVVARCIGYGADERSQGGWQRYRKMRVLDVQPGELTKAPEKDPTLDFDGDDEGPIRPGDDPDGDA